MQLLCGAQIQVCKFIPALLAAVRQTKQSWQQFPGRLAGRGSNKVTQVLVKDTTVVLISLVIQVNAEPPEWTCGVASTCRDSHDNTEE